MAAADDFKKEIPHFLVLALLVIVLMVVLTKFGWVHCTQVPGDWCELYCGFSGHSKVAVITGESGLGDADEMRTFIINERVPTYVDKIHLSELSYGLLKDFELVIFEGATDITPFQAQSIRQYLDSGGNIIWIADAGSHRVIDSKTILELDRKIEEARAYSGDPGIAQIHRNIGLETPNATATAADDLKAAEEYKKEYLNAINKTSGFGDVISQILRVQYRKVENGTSITFHRTIGNHFITSGLNATFEIGSRQIVVVDPTDSQTSVVAHLTGTASCTEKTPCPAIVESKYAGKIVYVAFPLEEAQSKTLILNMMDFMVTC